MNRSKYLALSAAALLTGAVGCSAYSDGKPVRVVRNSTEVASCQKVVDVKVSARLPQTEVLAEAANQARDKGADHLQRLRVHALHLITQHRVARWRVVPSL